MIKNNQGFSFLLLIILIGLTGLSITSVFKFLNYQSETSKLNGIRALKMEVKQKLEYLLADQSQCRTQFVDLSIPNSGQSSDIEIDYPSLNEKLKANVKLYDFNVDKLELENTETLLESEIESIYNTNIKVFLSRASTDRHELAPIYISKILRVDNNSEAVTDCVGSKDVSTFCQAFTKKYDPESNPRCRDLTEEELAALSGSESTGGGSGSTGGGDSGGSGSLDTSEYNNAFDFEYASCNPSNNSATPSGFFGDGIYVYGIKLKKNNQTFFALRNVRDTEPCEKEWMSMFVSPTTSICNLGGSTYYAEEIRGGFRVYASNGASCEARWKDSYNPNPSSTISGNYFQSITTSAPEASYRDDPVYGGYRIMNRNTCEFFSTNRYSEWNIKDYDVDMGGALTSTQMRDKCRMDCAVLGAANGIFMYQCYYMGVNYPVSF